MLPFLEVILYICIMIEHEKYGKFDKISNGYGFRESDHAYIDLSTGKRMTSVTTVIGTFQPVFDTEKKSLGVAKREVRNGIVKGVTVLERQQQLKKQWKDKNHKVSSYGTHLHYVLETMLVKKMSVQETLNFFNIKTLGDSEEAIRGRHEKKYIQFVHDLNLWDYDELICEDLLSSRKWGLSGQSDVVGIKNNKVYIRDWKFNSKMLSWDGFRGERFHFPLSHYETGKLRTYQLQGSIYMYLKCLQTGLEPGDIIFYLFLNGVITEHRLEYLEEEGYPPLRIGTPSNLAETPSVTIQGDTSSQYISALLLIAPSLPKGLTLTLSGKVVSRPYIEMTIRLMEHFGAQVSWEEDTITVSPVPYGGGSLRIEADWSAASYYYSMVACADGSSLTLDGLNKESLQGDSVLVDMMRSFGVESTFTEEGVRIEKVRPAEPIDFIWDFIRCPDLAQTLAVTCAITGRRGLFTGL